MDTPTAVDNAAKALAVLKDRASNDSSVAQTYALLDIAAALRDVAEAIRTAPAERVAQMPEGVDR